MCCFKKDKLTKCRVIGWLTFFLGLLITGSIIIAMRDDFFRDILEKNFPIVEGTNMYPAWVDIPTPLITSIYFFNVTNPTEVLNGGKPDLVEVGPWVFREHHHKKVIKSHHENKTITYEQIRTWKLDKEQTGANLKMSDNIITLNVPAASVIPMVKYLDDFLKLAIAADFEIFNEKLFVSKNISQLLFDGYSDPILTQTMHLPDSLIPYKQDKFGYFYPRNGSATYDGVFNMYTGERGDLEHLGQIARWNYLDKLKFFGHNGPCNDIGGAGDILSPGQKKTHVEMFSNDLCRILKLEYSALGPKTMHTIPGNMYKLSPKYFANATVNPNNACFSPGYETYSGLYNVSLCRFGAPIFMSQPHFYQADPYLLTQFKRKNTLKPEAEKHETALYVEPKTGLSVDVKARFQVNVLIEKVSKISIYSKLRKTYFPTVWFETRVELPDNFIFVLGDLVHMGGICQFVGWVLIGLSLVLGGFILAIYCSDPAPSYLVLIPPPDSNAPSLDGEPEQNERIPLLPTNR